MSKTTRSKKVIDLNTKKARHLSSEKNKVCSDDREIKEKGRALNKFKSRSTFSSIILWLGIILALLWIILIPSYLFLALPEIDQLLINPGFLLNSFLLTFLPVGFIFFSMQSLSENFQTRKLNTELLIHLQKLTAPEKEAQEDIKTISESIHNEIKRLNIAVKTSNSHIESMRKKIQIEADHIEKVTEMAAYQTSQSHQSMQEKKEILSDLIEKMHHHTKECESIFENNIQKMEDKIQSTQRNSKALNELLHSNDMQWSSFSETLLQYQNTFKTSQDTLKNEHLYFENLSENYQNSIQNYMCQLKEEAQNIGNQLIETLKHYIERSQTLNDRLAGQTQLSHSMNEQQIKKLKSVSENAFETHHIIDNTSRQAIIQLQAFDRAMRNTLRGLTEAAHVISEETKTINRPLKQQASAPPTSLSYTENEIEGTASETKTSFSPLYRKDLLSYSKDYDHRELQNSSSQGLETPQKNMDTLSWLEKIPPLTHQNTEKSPKGSNQIEPSSISTQEEVAPPTIKTKNIEKYEDIESSINSIIASLKIDFSLILDEEKTRIAVTRFYDHGFGELYNYIYSLFEEKVQRLIFILTEHQENKKEISIFIYHQNLLIKEWANNKSRLVSFFYSDTGKKYLICATAFYLIKE